MVETPVLFITFVRSGYARQTWEGIKAAKPKTLYFYSNKGRAEKEGEIERNEEIVYHHNSRINAYTVRGTRDNDPGRRP